MRSYWDKDKRQLVFTEDELAEFGGGDAHAARHSIMEFLRELRRKNRRAENSPTDTYVPGTVRMATEEDRAHLVLLTEKLHGENGLFSLSQKKRDVLLDRFYEKKGAIIGVIGEVGRPEASIYLSLTQPEYTDDWALVEVWNFVHPDHRQSDHAQNLIAYAKHVSAEMKIPLIIGILSNHRTEAKVRLYERNLDKVGAYFIWNQHLAGGAWGSA